MTPFDDLALACGHTCNCEYARQGELCDYGESKAEAAKDERGSADPFWLYVGATGVALGALTLMEPRLLLVLFGWIVLALPFAVWIGRRIARGDER